MGVAVRQRPWPAYLPYRRPLLLFAIHTYSCCPSSTSIEERMNSIEQELIAAAKENNLPEVSRLLSVGADANAKGRSYRTPLHWACCNGHVQVFQALLEHGSDIEAKDKSDATPLHWACFKGHVPVVNELLSPNYSNGATTTATTILGKRKSRGGANIEAKDKYGNTPLYMASRHGHVAIVKALLAVGADIEAKNNRGKSPLYSAMRKGKSEACKYLLQHTYATRHLPLHRLLGDLTGIGNTFIRNVLGTVKVVEIVDYLVERNPALLSSHDQDGSLPLHVACRRGAAFTIIQSLVHPYKASVKSMTPQGDLPLFLACDIPEPSLDTIFILMKLYPDLVYR
jgi:ankyrin repeat protein